MNVKKSCSHALLIFAGAAFGGFLSGHFWPSDSSALAAGRHPKTVMAERFVLLDANGKQRGAIQVSEDGMATLSLNDTNGRDRAELRVAGDGSAGLAFFDQNGRKLAVFGEGVDERSGIYIFGPEGMEKAGFGSLPTGASALALYDANTGLARAAVGIAAKGDPAVVLLDQTGAERMELSLQPDGNPGLALTDGKGKIIAGLPEIQSSTGANLSEGSTP
ncbi:MAG: hypothetical protein JO189_29590 [Deltaproteobacteria bacterium]|nr:hypothetical protein [Deltaproteobacteria bacterium]